MADISASLREKLAKLREKYKDTPPVDVKEWIRNQPDMVRKRERDTEYRREHQEKIREQQVRYRQDNRDKVLEYRKLYYQRHREDYANYQKRNLSSIRMRRYIKKYGDIQEDIQSLLEEQQNMCAICKEPFTSNEDRHLDHNHITGKVRGFLCSGCNLGLGKFKDDPTLLKRAIEYVSMEVLYSPIMETSLLGVIQFGN